MDEENPRMLVDNLVPKYEKYYQDDSDVDLYRYR